MTIQFEWEKFRNTALPEFENPAVFTIAECSFFSGFYSAIAEMGELVKMDKESGAAMLSRMLREAEEWAERRGE